MGEGGRDVEINRGREIKNERDREKREIDTQGEGERAREREPGRESQGERYRAINSDNRTTNVLVSLKKVVGYIIPFTQ